jgi:hypothetical protein
MFFLFFLFFFLFSFLSKIVIFFRIVFVDLIF